MVNIPQSISDSDKPTSLPVVLVVSGQAYNLTKLERMLSQCGQPLIIRTAHSGQEALHKTDNASVAILITDFLLPDMTGLQVLETLKKQECEPAYSVLLTAEEI